ncbi:hypothetical protein EUTSA_v10017950mg [Eutrema salsugineum]|uniref:Protein kinase domain-containing protein n=1 Tax=Eutrema salsugineum TaxID=72664 RepID=V4NWG8_EUTSA|nr:hypothetical protein EUTSA_v10017950mg [Eutrema salsugineum]
MEQICESRDPWLVEESSLTQACVLGRGSFGSVTLVGDPQLRAYAKKTCSINLFSNLEKELDIMLRFHNHPCIVTFVHLENNTRYCYIYMEYANKQTLHKMISEFPGKPLPEYMIQRAARMILQGLEALHAKGYVHCDLKPGNILLFHSTTFGEPFDLKLADFGLSKEPNSSYAHPCGSMFPGTPHYMPRESLGPNGLIDPALDIWSLGCVVYEMFGGEPEQELFENYYEWRLFEEISPVAKDFLRQCHGLHPSYKGTMGLKYPIRATASELLNHHFITQRLSVPLPTIIIQQ